MRWTCAALLAVFLSSTGTAFSQEPRWHRQFTDDGSISVEFPEKPDSLKKNNQERYVITKPGTDTQEFLGLMSTALPDGIDISNPRASLERGFTKAADTKYESITWKKINGLEAVETVNVKPGRLPLRVLALTKDRRLIILTYSSPLASINGPEAERFFSSFRVEK